MINNPTNNKCNKPNHNLQMLLKMIKMNQNTLIRKNSQLNILIKMRANNPLSKDRFWVGLK